MDLGFGYCNPGLRSGMIEMITKLIGIGHSHLAALRGAYEEKIQGNADEAGLRFEFVQLLEDRFKPNFHGGSEPALNDELISELQKKTGEPGQKIPFAFLNLSGNEYIFIGLVNHPKPFDFLSPDCINYTPRQGVEILPYGEVAATLQSFMEGAVITMRLLKKAMSVPLVFLQSPPPVGDDSLMYQAHIKGSQFENQVRTNGIAPSDFRMKLWRLQSSLYQTACASEGIAFVTVPSIAQDPKGFLVPEGWSADSVHASRWYGGQFLSKLEGLAMRPVAVEGGEVL